MIVDQAITGIGNVMVTRKAGAFHRSVGYRAEGVLEAAVRGRLDVLRLEMVDCEA